MVAWWIVLGILAAVALLLWTSVTLYVHLDEQLSLKWGIAGLKFWLVNPDEKEEEDAAPEEPEAQAPKEGEVPEKEAAEENKPPPVSSENQKLKRHKGKPNPSAKEDKPEDSNSKQASGGVKQTFQERLGGKHGRRSFGEVVELILDILSSVFDPSMALLRATRITALDLRMSIGDEEAGDTALAYAGYSSAVYCVLAVLQANIKVKVKRIELNANFISGETVQDISFKVKIRLGAVLWATLRMIGRFLRYTIKKQQRQAKIQQRKQSHPVNSKEKC